MHTCDFAGCEGLKAVPPAGTCVGNLCVAVKKAVQRFYTSRGLDEFSSILSKMGWDLKLLCLRHSENLKVTVSECGMVFAASVKSLFLSFPVKLNVVVLHGGMIPSCRQNLQSLQVPPPPCSFFL